MQRIYFEIIKHFLKPRNQKPQTKEPETAIMGAQKASWQEAFAAEAATLGGLEHAQALLDLVKAFETVPHWVLVEAAKLKGYPGIILQLCLAAYRLARSIGVDGVYSRTIVATRGITAGSGFCHVRAQDSYA